jgi:hypothetical protein
MQHVGRLLGRGRAMEAILGAADFDAASAVNRTSTCWPARWPGQPGTSKTIVLTRGVSATALTSSASCQVSQSPA